MIDWKSREIFSSLKVPPDIPIVVRVDGWRFRKVAMELELEKPFDRRLIEALANIPVKLVEGVFPITMGANIGTTATAILASFATGNPSAIIIAFVHFLFNTIGVLFIYPFKICRRVPIYMAKWLGDLAFKKRRYALIYVISVFFLLPGILILVTSLFK